MKYINTPPKNSIPAQTCQLNLQNQRKMSHINVVFDLECSFLLRFASLVSGLTMPVEGDLVMPVTMGLEYQLHAEQHRPFQRRIVSALKDPVSASVCVCMHARAHVCLLLVGLQT